MILALAIAPVIVHFFRKPVFFNSSFSNGIILVFLIIILKFLNLDNSGSLSTALFVVLLVLPLLIQKKICEKILNQNFKEVDSSLNFLKIVCPLFPSGEVRTYVKQLAQEPEIINRDDLLKYKPASVPSLIAVIQIHFLKADWNASGDWIKNFNERELEKVPWLTLLNIRVLCENDRIEEAVEFTSRVKQNQNQYFYFIYHLIYLSAYCGHTSLLEKIYQLPMNDLKEKNRDFWMAVSLYNNTDTREEGQSLLEEMSDSDDRRIALSSKRFLQNTELTDKVRYRDSVSLLSKELFSNLEDYLGPVRRSLTCTNTLFAVNLILYLLSRPDANPNFVFEGISKNLVLLMPESMERNEWWRLLTTTFLHGGFLHFISNIMMLFVFGYMVEPFFKASKFLFIYLGAGIFGMVLVTMTHQPGTQTVILGASGSTMALMGAYIAILLKQNSRSSVKMRKQQLIFLFIFILVQSRIDYISPQISFTAHISGLVFGLISAYIFYKPLYADLEKKIESYSG